MGFFDYFFIICRTYGDFVHILMYLVLIIISSLIAYYKYDKNSFTAYYYKFFKKIKFISNFKLIKILLNYTLINFTKLHLKLSSNRLPYLNKLNSNKIIKTIKTWFK